MCWEENIILFLLSHGYLLVWRPSHVITSLSHVCQNSFQFQIRERLKEQNGHN